MSHKPQQLLGAHHCFLNSELMVCKENLFILKTTTKKKQEQQKENLAPSQSSMNNFFFFLCYGIKEKETFLI